MKLTREYFKDKIEEVSREEICIIPNNITSIDKGAFLDWSNLKYVYVPSSVVDISDDVFCDNVLKIYISMDSTKYNDKNNVNKLVDLSNGVSTTLLLEILDLKNFVKSNPEDLKVWSDNISELINSTKKNYSDIESMYNENKKLFEEAVEFSNGSVEKIDAVSKMIIDKVDDSTKKRLLKIDSLLTEYQENIISESTSSINDSVSDKIEALKKYKSLLDGAPEVIDKLKNVSKNVNADMDSKLRNLTREVNSIISEVVDKSVEKVIDANPYKQTNIVIDIDSCKKKTTFKGVIHKDFENILRLIAMRKNLVLKGPAGCGKNFIIEKVGEALDLEMYYSNDITDEYKVLGFVDANGIFQETQFFKAFTKGGLMFIDEMDNSNPSALLAINSALGTGSGNYMAFPDGKLYKAHENFHLVAAANTFGTGSDSLYCGRSTLDGASLNRFLPYVVDYDRDVERDLVSNEELLPLYWKVRELLVENDIRHIISTRNIMNADDLISSKQFKLGDIFDWTLIQSMTDEDLRVISKSIGSSKMERKFIGHLETRGITTNDYKVLKKDYNDSGGKIYA